MDLAKDCIVSEEKWDSQREEIQRWSISKIREHKQQGLLSKGEALPPCAELQIYQHC